MDTARVTTSTLTDLLFHRAEAGLCLVAPDGTVVRANAEWLRWAGLAADQVVGEDLVELLPDTRELFRAPLARARAGHRSEVPRHARVVNGRETSWEGAVEPVQMQDGTGLLVTAREMRRGEAEHPRDAASTGALLRAMVDGTDDLVAAVDSSFRFLAFNRAYAREMARLCDREIRVGDSMAELLAPFPRDQARAVELWDRALRGEAFTIVQEFGDERRGRAWYEIRFNPLCDVHGVSIGAVQFVRDVTERRRAELALRENEERFRLLAEAMPQIVCVVEPDGGVVDVNSSWTSYSGLDREATARLGWPGVLHPDDVAAAIECRRRTLKTLLPQDVELRYRAADGSHQWFLCRLAPVAENGRVVRLVGAGMNIDGRRRAEEALRESEARLREADRRKDEFLGMLSHELRNPLAPIRNSTYILRRATPGSEAARHAQEVIERQTEHLTRLVDDLLDVTRIASGRIELRRSRLDLREVVRRSAEDFRSLLADRGIAFRTDVPEFEVPVDADATRIAQAVGNLLSNAAKFTHPGGQVTLTLRVRGGDAEIRVRDTGAGIDPTLMSRIFERFFQGEHTLARSEGGLGLGLALVKGIAELHGGSVQAHSEGRGRGAEMVLQLPRLAPAAVEGGAREPVQATTGGRRVLVVDDNRDAAETLATIVELLGNDVVVAYDGPSALEYARTVAPDVVLCDIGLPGLSGYDVARALRAAGTTAQLFAISGYAQPEDVRNAVEAGFDGHVAKPTSIEDIQRLLA